MHYDTLIIGAGLSGLAAGIRLAYFERPVCILERHTTIGGLNSFYRLRNRNYDVGLHAVTNYAPPGTKTGPLSKLIRQLRLSWDDFALCPQIESRVAFPAVSLRFSNDFELLASQIAERFPREIDGFQKLSRFIDEQELGRPVAPNLTARPVLAEYLGDPLLVDMLLCPLMFYGSPTPHDMDLTQFVIMFRSIFREGLARPRGGVRVILRQLIRQYKELGGELRLRAGVKSILNDGRRATGVLLDDGSVIEADRILSSAGFAETMGLCRDSGRRDSAHDGVKPGEITFVETIATLDRQPTDLGLRETVIFYSNTPEFHYENPSDPCDLSGGIVCSPNNFAYDEPLSEGAVRITALANKSAWMNFAREEDYVAAKALWQERITESALTHIPDFRPAVIDTDMFTPRTIRHFTGHLNGCVYGHPKKRWDGRTYLDNVFLCGTDQGFLGIVGSMLSGISMANQHALRS